MKKTLLFLAVFFTATIFAKAQTNIQVMYDFGKDRQNVTTTLEMFKGDNWGSTFFFVDITHDGKFQHKDGVDHSAPIGAYTEIARSLNFWQNSKLGALSAHVEYNGGLGVVPGLRLWHQQLLALRCRVLPPLLRLQIHLDIRGAL